MKLQRQPNSWSCFPTALAIACDVSIKKVLKIIGHDGSQIIRPKLEDPFNRVAFHSSEIICAAWELGFALTEFPVSRILGYNGDFFELPKLDVHQYLKDQPGIILGSGFWKTPHAVAWDGKLIYDPNYSTYELNQFQIRDFYALTRRTY
jgi:hypothetical protein